MKVNRYNGPSRKPCKHPGCLTMLYRHATTYDTGYCRQHGGMHKGRADVAPVADHTTDTRPGIRDVLVQMNGPAQSSTVDAKMVRVSLPREPWL
jgi:hypothetical protein